MTIAFEVSDVIPAEPEVLFAAWLNSVEHAKMTGSPASASPQVGEPFEAWDGYIRGKNLALESPSRILQSWRTTEFQDSEEDSLLEILFKSERHGTRVTIRHINLPAHGMQYRQGWVDSYFIPMKRYFGEKSA